MLIEEADRTGTYAGEQILVGARNGQDDDRQVRIGGDDFPGRVDTVHDGHVDVHQYEVQPVRSKFECTSDSISAVGLVAHHLDIWFTRQQAA